MPYHEDAEGYLTFTGPLLPWVRILDDVYEKFYAPLGIDDDTWTSEITLALLFAARKQWLSDPEGKTLTTISETLVTRSGTRHIFAPYEVLDFLSMNLSWDWFQATMPDLNIEVHKKLTTPR